MRISFVSLALAAAMGASVLGATAQARPFDVDDLVRLNRLSSPQVSPDGTQVIYSLRETDFAANKAVSQLWLLALDGKSEPRQLTSGKASSSSARFSSDGKHVYFLSARSGSMQLWRIALSGGEAQQMSELPLDIGSFKLAPDGRRIAFSMEVFTECDGELACTRRKLDAQNAAKTSGRLHDKLFVRHWDTWSNGTRSQLFIANMDRRGVGKPQLLSQQIDGDVPSKPFGDDSEYSFSPDGRKLIFTARIAGRSEPWSTNFDLFEVPTDGSETPRNLTPDNEAWDTQPLYSPDGQWLVYKAMTRPTFEADRFRIMLRNLGNGSERELTPDWDRSPDWLEFSADGRTLYASAGDTGQTLLFSIDVKSGAVKPLLSQGHVGGAAVAGNRLIAAIDNLAAPADLYSVPLHGNAAPKRLTEVNADKLEGVQFGDYEQFSFKGWNDETVYGYVVKPVDFQQGQQYPVAFIIHGGPQGSMGNFFHYRWNPQTHAGKGFAVVFIDFHGSTGYGQAFTDSISGDWGGKPLEDLQKGLAHARATYDFLSPDKACALGGSYGGYMVNWIAGAWPDGFQCLVSHAGIFDNRFMAFSTEELWFDEWEFGGLQWEKPENYERQNPVNLIPKWVTPMLVIHGQLDYRVPFEQGLSLFTALQRKGVESQFLWFPDENHWILKPENSVQWHRTVESWLGKHLQ